MLTSPGVNPRSVRHRTGVRPGSNLPEGSVFPQRYSGCCAVHTVRTPYIEL